MDRFWQWARVVGWATSTALMIMMLGYLLVGLMAALNHQRDHNRQRQSEAQKRQEQSAQEISYRCALGVENLESIRVCIAKEIQAYREDNKSSQELEVQQQAANWALGSMFLSAFALIVSAFGLWMLRESLRHTRAAIEISRDIGHAQTRAYLSITPHIKDLIVGQSASASIIITNEGQSPATCFAYIADIYMLDHPTPDSSFPLIAVADGQPRNSGVVPPKGTMTCEAVSREMLTLEDTKSIQGNGPRRLYVVVHAFYSDVFGQPHTSKLCAYTEASPIRGQPKTFMVGFVASRLGNEAT